jgi:hypothetical protein
MEFLQVGSTAPSATNAHPMTLQGCLGLATPVRPAVINEQCESSGPRLPDALADNLGAGLTNIAAEMHADRQA